MKVPGGCGEISLAMFVLRVGVLAEKAVLAVVGVTYGACPKGGGFKKRMRPHPHPHPHMRIISETALKCSG